MLTVTQRQVPGEQSSAKPENASSISHSVPAPLLAWWPGLCMSLHGKTGRCVLLLRAFADMEKIKSIFNLGNRIMKWEGVLWGTVGNRHGEAATGSEHQGSLPTGPACHSWTQRGAC